jgi:hypothetical protein
MSTDSATKHIHQWYKHTTIFEWYKHITLFEVSLSDKNFDDFNWVAADIAYTDDTLYVQIFVFKSKPVWMRNTKGVFLGPKNAQKDYFWYFPEACFVDTFCIKLLETKYVNYSEEYLKRMLSFAEGSLMELNKLFFEEL